MQINNQVSSNHTLTHDKPLELRQGEIYRATIKQRGPENEATLQIRGRDVQVKFDGRAPGQDRVTVQISHGQTADQPVQVRAISDAPSRATVSPQQAEAANINQALRSLGVSNPSQELRQAAQIILDKGVPLNRESVQDLRAFIEKEKGTLQERLNTVQAVANKRLEVTSTHLRSVHEALHGRPLNDVLTSIAKGIDPDFKVSKEEGVKDRTQAEPRVLENRTQPESRVTESRNQAEPRVMENRTQTETRTQTEPRVVESRLAQDRPVSEQVRQVREQVQREPNVQRSIEQVRNEVVNNQLGDREVARQVEARLTGSLVTQAGQDATQPVARAEQVQVRPTEALKQMQTTVQKEADFQKVVSQLNSQIEKAPLEQSTKEHLNQNIQDATKLQDQGRELAARQQLMQTLTATQQQVAKTEPAIQPEVQQYAMNEVFQTQQLSSKDLIVKTVTEKLAKAQTDFKTIQREITRNLDNIQRLTETFKSQAIKQVKPLLETTIKKLDHAILKSEMMLFTDMKTEKRLMQASSQLAEAKKFLNKGNYKEANKIVQEVKNLIEKLEFKPSETKIKHFITKEEQNLQSRSAPQQLLQQFDEMTRRTAAPDFSARQAFDLVRGLGLNRDSEMAMLLASGKQADTESNQNMKQALMQLKQMEEEQGRVSQQTSQALSNITGQQLLSKSDTNTNLQSMFFNLPFLLEDEVKNLQVFVNSRNEGQQVDWENCNLYFLIETKKLGEVGILVTATDRNLSLTIKNDQPLFKEKLGSVADICKENLKEVGYNVASINFTTLTAAAKSTVTPQEVSNEEKMIPTFTEKGFDFKI
ncbi:hypothetical protein RJD24_05350 [Bacillaceae bacterium IKA-2]|nr:hypothetical protein RJD24_05350 [Bacillaceae bacterium IKA-2]